MEVEYITITSLPKIKNMSEGTGGVGEGTKNCLGGMFDGGRSELGEGDF